jgi:hypothetical protein
MIRYVGYVETIDWENNTCKVRIPNVDGLAVPEYGAPALRLLLPNRAKTEHLEDADIPYHLQGLRVGDVVYVLDAEDPNDKFTIVGFYGGVYKEE